MEETYKDWKIKVNESTDEFVATKDDHVLRNKSLKDLKKKIDKFTFKRIPVYYQDYNRTHSGEITSIVERGDSDFSNRNFWITYDGKHTKTTTSHLFRKSEKNKKLFDEIQQLRKNMDELDKQINEKVKQLEPLTNADIGFLYSGEN